MRTITGEFIEVDYCSEEEDEEDVGQLIENYQHEIVTHTDLKILSMLVNRPISELTQEQVDVDLIKCLDRSYVREPNEESKQLE